jgi:hypothetical protein
MEEIKSLIAATYDVTELLDILDMDMEDLVEELEDRILENLYMFKDIDPGDYDE